MSDAGPHASGDVFNRNVVPCSGDGIRGTQASATSVQQQRVVVLTDMVSPPPSSIAGAELATNLMKIKQSGVTVHGPRQGVSAFRVPGDLLAGTCVFLIGSPAGHDPFNVPLDQDTASGNVRFKEEVFYSLCYATPPDSAVVMTYSNGACGRLEFWTLPDTYPPRTLVVAPAWFAHYRPRRGLADALHVLVDETCRRRSLHLCAGERTKSMAARRYLGGFLGPAASSALPATRGSLRPTSSVTGASNAVVSARRNKRLGQPSRNRTTDCSSLCRCF